MHSTRHQPISSHVPGSDTAVLMIHGIQGSPDQFDFLIEALSGQYTIQTLLLPGHGRQIRDFAKSSMAQWQAHVDKALTELAREYKHIFLVGHSMGCLLSLQAAVSHPKNVAGLFFLAPAFKMFISGRCISCNARMLFSEKDADEIVAAIRRGNSVMANTPFAYLLGAPRFAELMQKARACQTLLDICHLPITAVHSENDEIISKKTVSILKGRPNVRVLVAKESSHYHYPPKVRKALAKLLQEFIQKHRENRNAAL
jgi:esterase/lipase